MRDLLSKYHRTLHVITTNIWKNQCYKLAHRSCLRARRQSCNWFEEQKKGQWKQTRYSVRVLCENCMTKRRLVIGTRSRMFLFYLTLSSRRSACRWMRKKERETTGIVCAFRCFVNPYKRERRKWVQFVRWRKCVCVCVCSNFARSNVYRAERSKSKSPG